MAFFLVLAALPLQAQGTIPLSDSQDSVVIGDQLEYFLDESTTLTFEQVHTGAAYRERFEQSSVKTLNFGFTQAVCWIRFQLKNELDRKETWFLEMSYPPVDHLDLYIVDEADRVRVKKSGDLLPFDSRDFQHRNFIFSLPLEANSTHTFYLRVQTESSMQIPLTIWSNQAFIAKDHSEQIIFGIYYGIMLVMFVYNVFIYFTVRDISYLYYVCYIFIYSILQATLNGFAYEFLWPTLTWWNNRCLVFTIANTVAAILLFTRSLLNLSQDAPRLNRINLIMALVMSLIGFGTLFVEYRTGIQIGLLPVLASLGLAIATGIYRLMNGYRPARYFLFAWSALLLGALLITLKAAKVLPSNFLTDNGMQIGSALEVVLLSFALGEKINLMRDEKEAAQAQTLESQRQAMEAQKRLMDSFSRFVPREFLKFLDKDSITQVQLGDAVLRKSMTVLFTDIRSFTSLSESMTPAENFKFINSLLKRMEPHIQNHNGFVDKFVGDAIMALFSDLPDDALTASIEMREELAKYNVTRIKRNYRPIDIGIGLNTGQVVLGTVGSVNRIDTTVIGDTVNLASRMEGLTKMFRASIMISHYTYEALVNPERFKLRNIDRVAVKGKKEPVDIYELFNTDEPEIRDKKLKNIPLLNEMLAHYRAGRFKEALKVLREYYKDFPEDYIAKIYITRCRHYVQSPPPEGEWDGVSVLSKK